MKVKQIEKPIVKSRTTIGQAFDEMFQKSLPIHAWEQRNREIKKKIKL